MVRPDEHRDEKDPSYLRTGNLLFLDVWLNCLHSHNLNAPWC